MIFRFERADQVSGDIQVQLASGKWDVTDAEPVLETDSNDVARELRDLPQLVEVEAQLSEDELSAEGVAEAVEAHNQRVLAARAQASVPGDDAATAAEQNEPAVGSELAVPPVVEHEDEVADESNEDDEFSDEEVHE